MTSLFAVREATGVDAGPEMAIAFDSLSLDAVDDLVDQILARGTRSRPAAPGVDQVWPVVTLRASTFASGGVYRDVAGPAGLNLAAAMNPRIVGTGRFSDGVLRALLYCHGLVIEDPLSAAAEMYQGTRGEMRPVARLAVAAALRSSIEIFPLLDAGIVYTFFGTTADQTPSKALSVAIGERLASGQAGFSVDDAWEAFEQAYIDGLTAPLQKLWQRVRSGDRTPPLGLIDQGLAEGDADVVSTFIAVLRDIRPQAVVDNAVDMLASTVTAVEQLGGFFDLLCPSPLFAKLLFLGSPDPVHELRLHELGRVPVPGITDISISDAVKIRQSSDAFEGWRTDLSSAVSYARGLRDRAASPDEICSATREIVADARAALHREARRSRFLSPSNLLTFITGALGGAVAGSPGGAAGAGYGSVGAGLGTLGALVQSTSTSGRIPGYLDRHYLVFEQPSEPDTSQC